MTVNVSDCGFDSHSRNIYLNVYFHFFALVSRQSVTLGFINEHAMAPEFSGKKEGQQSVYGIQCEADILELHGSHDRRVVVVGIKYFIFLISSIWEQSKASLGSVTQTTKLRLKVGSANDLLMGCKH